MNVTGKEGAKKDTGTVKATAGYIVNFYQAIEGLNVYVSQYIDMSVRMSSKYENSDDEAITEPERNEMMTMTQTLRTLIFQLNIKAKAMAKKIDAFKKSEAKIKKVYDKLIEAPAFKRADLEEFAQLINEAFMEGISYDTLGQLADIYSALSGAMDMSMGGEIEG